MPLWGELRLSSTTLNNYLSHPHSFGNSKTKRLPRDRLVTTTTVPPIQPLRIIKKNVVEEIPTHLVRLAQSDSYKKWLFEEQKKVAACALNDGTYPDMPDTPPRYKRPAVERPVTSTSIITPSRSASLRKWRRREGANVAQHALTGGPYPEMPETPERLKRLASETVTHPTIAAFRVALHNIANNLEEYGTVFTPAIYPVPANEDVICSPTRTGPDSTVLPIPASSPSAAIPCSDDIFSSIDCNPASTALPISTQVVATPYAEDEFVIIDPSLREIKVPRGNSVLRLVSKAKAISRPRRRVDKENTTPSPSSSPCKGSPSSLSSLTPVKFLSRKFHARGSPSIRATNLSS